MQRVHMVLVSFFLILIKIELIFLIFFIASLQKKGVMAIDVEPDSSQLTAPIRTLLSSIGRLEHVPESQMDAACAIGGNGLAFGYYFMNAMADGAFKNGSFTCNGN